jgi:hypothetical protein
MVQAGEGIDWKMVLEDPPSSSSIIRVLGKIAAQRRR